MNTTGARGSAGGWLKSTQTQGKDQVRALQEVKGMPQKKEGAPPGGAAKVTPLLCLNTWEHVWLRDYGIGLAGQGGKKAFAEAWWEAVDWESVAYTARLSRPGEQQRMATKDELEKPSPAQTTTNYKGEESPMPRF
jgi:Fe-Mn family superoxide dismutase